MTMSPRRRSDDPLPRSPLDFAYPLTVRGAGSESTIVLGELPPEHAFHVLGLLRGLLAWSTGHPAFAGDTAERLRVWLAGGDVEALSVPVGTILDELRSDHPDPVSIADACFAISDWALSLGAEGTALLLAEAAALACPADARCAWRTGRLLRDHGRMRDAERWLRRAGRVAVWNGDVETLDLALNSLGNLRWQQGRPKEAVPLLRRALRVAKGLGRERRAAVTHDLFAAQMATGEFTGAEDYARSAFNLYGPRHPNLSMLAHDVGQLWTGQGRPNLALRVFKALLPLVPEPVRRLQMFAAMARAAGACLDREAFESAWSEAWKLTHLPFVDRRPVFSFVLVDLGYGAIGIGAWDLASEALSRAVVMGRIAHRPDVVSLAQEAMVNAARHEPLPELQLPVSKRMTEFADALVESLTSAGIDKRENGLNAKASTGTRRDRRYVL